MDEKFAIDLEHVTRIYKRDEFEVRALDDVTVQVPVGRFVAIMGPSGSGKTTMLNLIAGIDHASSGRVAVGGEEITGMKERDLAGWRARHIGLVFQFYNLIPVLTAFENVELPLLLTSLNKAERRAACGDRAQGRRVGRPDGPLSAAVVGRAGAAGGDRARDRGRPDDYRRGRADRRPRREVGGGNIGAAGGYESAVSEDDRDGDARSAGGAIRRYGLSAG